LHALLAEHLPGDAEPDQVVVEIETDRGPWVQALLAAGYPPAWGTDSGSRRVSPSCNPPTGSGLGTALWTCLG
jgi:hypothetical protein